MIFTKWLPRLHVLILFEPTFIVVFMTIRNIAVYTKNAARPA